MLARSYAEVVEDGLGAKGAVVLTAFLTLELLATVSICLLFMWANLETLLPHTQK